MEYTPEQVLDLFASPFVDPALFAARVGGDRRDLEAVRRYLALPIAARPDLACYFDRAWYCLRFPDIGQGDFDPLTHFLGWGAWPTTSAPSCASARSSWRSGTTARPRAA
jgi:hypothetical protein